MSNGPDTTIEKTRRISEAAIAIDLDQGRYETHQTLSAMMCEPGGARNFIYCPIRTASGRTAALLRGSLDDIGTIPAESRRTAKFPMQGERHRMRLSANPIWRDENRREHQYSMHDDNDPRLKAWLERRAREHGFEIETSTWTIERAIIRKPPKPFTINIVHYDATITITDAHLFALAYAGGLGRSKYLGCGTILLSPIPDRHHQNKESPR